MSITDEDPLMRSRREGRFVPGALAALTAEGWRQADGVEVCDRCWRGTTSRAPDGKPRHLRCEPKK